MEQTDWNRVVAVSALAGFLVLAIFSAISQTIFLTFLAAVLGLLFGMVVTIVRPTLRARHFVQPTFEQILILVIFAMLFVATYFAILGGDMLLYIAMALLNYTFGRSLG